MPEKNLVDDYYSQINSWADSSDGKEQKKKTKIVAKKKIIVKKPKATDKKSDADFKAKKSETPSKKIISKRPEAWGKKFVQKIEVVKDIPKPKKFTVKSNRDNNRPSNSKPGSSNKPGQKKEEVKFKLRNTANKPQKKFHDNKKPVSHFESAEDKKKSKLAGGKRKTRGKFNYIDDKEVTFLRSNKTHKKEEKKVEDIVQNLVERKWETVVVPEILSLKELSEKIWVILPKLMAEFMKNGMMVTINSKIDFDSASIVAEAFEVKLERDSSGGASVEDIVSWDISELLKEDDTSKLQDRTPVVSIMWHVDHGKTSLLDHIRKAKVAAGEAGWITQSIWAYQVEMENGKITFLDTPGHEAFTVMRARWAKSTDIAILVVAADEWVKPQTIESINHAKEAGIPVIVAINKMDKPWANPDHVKWQLAEHGLTAEDWGWDTPMVPVSAHTWFWIDELLEIILLVAEMQELKANSDRAWIATVIESHLDSKLWPVATVLINTGTINMSDNIVCQDSYGKIKVLKNYNNQSIKLWIPGEPVLIVGLDKVVDGWDVLQVVQSVELAKQKAEEYRTIIASKQSESASWLALLMSKIKSGNLKQLKIILKADTNGSLEAIRWSLLKLSTEETEVQIIHAWVGSINEGDILMWQWSEAILVWFNVWVLTTAKSTLETAWVEYISSDIIYHITERIEKIITGMLDPKEIEIELWKAKVWGIFFTGKGFMIVWLIIAEDNKVEKSALVRIIRNKKMVGSWTVDSLKSWTLEVKELEWPIECWINLKTSAKVEIWDTLEIHKVEIQK